MGTTSSITMQSLVKIALRAPAVGAKTWCLFFCLFVTLHVRITLLALKILLSPPRWWGLETDWHEFPNCTICWERQSG